MHTLENAFLSVTVEDQGAQLARIYDKEKQRELLWNADPAFWKYHAPILFPLVGMVNGGEYRYQGKTYHVHQHGFAREVPFTCMEETAGKISHVLKADAQTQTLYPFDFELTVSHALEGRELQVQWTVFNPSETETMYFSIGAHPAFMVPVSGDAAAEQAPQKEDCFVYFPGKEALKYILVDLSVTAADTEHVYTMELDQGYLQLKRHLFDIDTFIFEDGQIEEVSLCGPDRKPYITVKCPGFPYFGLWTKSDEAPFVCLEPWHGRLDDKGFAGELPQKTGIRKLSPLETFTTSYTIEVC